MKYIIVSSYAKGILEAGEKKFLHFSIRPTFSMACTYVKLQDIFETSRSCSIELKFCISFSVDWSKVAKIFKSSKIRVF